MLKNLEAVLSSKGINPTAMRLLVLQFLQMQSAAISLFELEKGMKPANRATIFRTLKTFEENGLVHRIEDGSGSAKFALCDAACEGDHHHDVHVHFYCTKCQETLCLPNTLIPEVSLPADFHGTEMSLLVKGLCNQCSNRESGHNSL